jgi:hypothetical protein
MRYAHLAPNDGGDMRRALDRSSIGHGISVASEGNQRPATAAS